MSLGSRSPKPCSQQVISLGTGKLCCIWNQRGSSTSRKPTCKMNWTLAGLMHTDKPRHTEDEWNQLQKPQTIHTEGLKKIRSSITVILSYKVLLRQRLSSKNLEIQWWPYYLLKSTHHFTSWFWHTGVAMRCCTQMKKARPSQTFCSCALLANFGVHLPLVDYVQRREIAPPRTGKDPSRTDLTPFVFQ